jgi:hypothetical protein
MHATPSDINRLSKDETLAPFKARILVLSVSGETSVQYIPIMNCIFAAQKAVRAFGAILSGSLVPAC